MNIEEYIASGILDLYVLGELSSAEAKEVEEMAVHHTEIQKEIQRIQETFVALAMQGAIEPRPGLREEILSSVTRSESASPKTQPPVLAGSRHKARAARFFQYGMAASIALAVIAIITALYFRSQWKEAEHRLSELVAQNQQMAQQYETTHQEVQQLTAELSVITDQRFKTIEMAGLDPSPNSFAYVYWNQNSDQVYLKVNSLPPNASGKQYQLWAIVDGKPVDAGVFDVESNGQQRLTAMKNIENASAFAVTLEPQGGSESPTMEAMYVKGAVENT